MGCGPGGCEVGTSSENCIRCAFLLAQTGRNLTAVWETKMGRRNNHLRYAADTKGQSKEELKRLLMRAEENSDRAGLRLNIKKKKQLRS